MWRLREAAARVAVRSPTPAVASMRRHCSSREARQPWPGGARRRRGASSTLAARRDQGGVASHACLHCGWPSGGVCASPLLSSPLLSCIYAAGAPAAACARRARRTKRWQREVWSRPPPPARPRLPPGAASSRRAGPPPPRGTCAPRAADWGVWRRATRREGSEGCERGARVGRVLGVSVAAVVLQWPVMAAPRPSLGRVFSATSWLHLGDISARSRPDLGQISARSRPDLGQISASCRGSPSLEFDAAQERRGERRDAEVGEDDDGEGCGDDCLVRDMVRLTPLSLPPPSALQV